MRACHSPDTPRRRPAIAAACPAASIGAQIKDTWRALEALPANGYASAEQDLWDRLDYLDRQLEWAEPKSLAGVYLVAAQVNFLTDLLSDAVSDVERDVLLRRISRLIQLSLHGLGALAGIDPAQIGAAQKVADGGRGQEASKAA